MSHYYQLKLKLQVIQNDLVQTLAIHHLIYDLKIGSLQQLEDDVSQIADV